MPEYIAEGLRWLEGEIAPPEPEPDDEDESEDEGSDGGADGEHGDTGAEDAVHLAVSTAGNGFAA